MFPQKRIQIISEYSGLVYVGHAIPNTSFGARDPVDSVYGIRVYPWHWLALDVGYRYNLNLTNQRDRNGFVVKLGAATFHENVRAGNDKLTATCSADKQTVALGSAELVEVTMRATDAMGHPLNYSWTANGGKISGSGPYARWAADQATPGTFILTGRVDDGPAGHTAACSVEITVSSSR